MGLGTSGECPGSGSGAHPEINSAISADGSALHFGQSHGDGSQLTIAEQHHLELADSIVSWFVSETFRPDAPEYALLGICEPLGELVRGESLTSPLSAVVKLDAVCNLLDYLDSSSRLDNAPNELDESEINALKGSLATVKGKVLASTEFKSATAELGTSDSELDSRGSLIRSRIHDLGTLLASEASPRVVELSGLLAEAGSRGTNLHDEMHDDLALSDETLEPKVVAQLDAVVQLGRELGAALKKENHPETYDVLLGRFDPDVTTEILDPLFTTISKEIGELMEEVRQRQNQDQTKHETLNPVDLGHDAHDTICESVIDGMGWHSSLGIENAGHPTCYSVMAPLFSAVLIGKDQDDPGNLVAEIFDVRHEAGHAVLASALSPDIKDSLLTLERRGISMALDETAAMFSEITVGKSRAYWEGQLSKLQEQHAELSNVSVDQVLDTLRALPEEASPIRLEATDLQYPLHIVVRYQVERELLNGDLEAPDAIERFNGLLQEHLGVTPSDLRESLPQDPHMLEAEFGYFPQYLVALVASAQLYASALKSVPSAEEQLALGNEKPLWDWFRDRVANNAGVLPLPELVREATGKDLGVHDYLSMLWNRYGKHYGLSIPTKYQDSFQER